jgi:hypothetical protein
MISVRLAIGIVWVLWMSCETWASICPLHLVTVEQDCSASADSKGEARRA